MEEKVLILTYGVSIDLKRRGIENDGYIDYELYSKFSEKILDISKSNFCFSNNIITMPEESNCLFCPLKDKECTSHNVHRLFYEDFFESED